MGETGRLIVAPMLPEHAPAQLAYYRRNRTHLGPWEPAWPNDFLTLDYWEHVAARAREDAATGSNYRYVVFERSEPAMMVGSVNLNNVVRGVFAAAHLGYSVDAARQGNGIGTDAVRRVVELGFTRLRLHRIMANYQPVNERSGRLLRRLGFVPEGYARDYLYIAGAWRDHVLTALINPDKGFRP